MSALNDGFWIVNVFLGYPAVPVHPVWFPGSGRALFFHTDHSTPPLLFASFYVMI